MNKIFKHAALLLAFQIGGATQGWCADVVDELSLEDLTKTEITSVARKTQNLASVPAAAFVISADDIARSGALALPDVLRMVPGIEVAQIDNGRYAVTARGFNGRFANKLQVLVDGRSIYHQTFSGVMWEHDVIALNDIERIEVIRGPGAAIWGVNAVNGVINIISKHSAQQSGGFVETTIGTQGKLGLYGRYGGALDENTTWRASVQGRHAEPSKQFATGADSEDRLESTLLDMRLDHRLGGGSDLALWFNATRSVLGDLIRVPVLPGGVLAENSRQSDASQVLAGRYRWLTAAGIESSLQLSLNSSSIELEKYFREERKTYDLDYQGRYTFAAHDLLWGISHRTSSSSAQTPGSLISLRNHDVTQRTSGVFVQDDWTLIPEKLQLGLGARWDNTNIGGSTFAPSATLIWTPSRVDTLWAKYARAPRMPSQGENNVSMLTNFQPGGPAVFTRVVAGTQTLRAEKMEGLELGYRTQLSSGFNIDASVYRYRYSDRISSVLGARDLSGLPNFIIQNVNICNCSAGWVSGAELSADWQVLPVWRLQLSYAWTRIQMDEAADAAVQADGKQTEQGTPRHHGSLRSQWNVAPDRQFDAWLRASGGYQRINAPYTDLTKVSGYLTLDLRYAQKIGKDLELVLSGRNLIGPSRIEYVSDYVASVPVKVGPSVFLSTRWKF